MDTFGLFAFAFSDCFPFTGGESAFGTQNIDALVFLCQNL